MRILFVTRKYPPIAGGMERYSKDLYEALSGVAEVALCANRRGNRMLPFFLLVAALKIATEGRRYDVIHLGDGLLAVLIPIARAFSRAAVTITAHGLDVTYRNPLYERSVVPLLRAADLVICVSGNTRAACVSKGVLQGKTVVIPNGIALPSESAPAERPDGLPDEVEGKRILCTVGRLVRRKGHEWFIREVMGLLDASYVYLIAGDGPERPWIERAIIERGLEGRVFLLGRIGDREREWLFGESRLFMMPNVPVSGDVEGFGLVLVEAAARGLMAIASDLDGIPDAVVPGVTAVLVAPLDPPAFADAIAAATPDRARVKDAASSFARERIAGRYLEAMRGAARAASKGRIRR